MFQKLDSNTEGRAKVPQRLTYPSPGHTPFPFLIQGLAMCENDAGP